jgi:hypothetical protein
LTLFSAVTISVVANALSVAPTISITDLQLISSAQVRIVDHHMGLKMLQLHDMNWYMQLGSVHHGVRPESSSVSHVSNYSVAHNVIVYVSLRPSLEVVEQSSALRYRLASLVESHHGINTIAPNVRQKRSLL